LVAPRAGAWIETLAVALFVLGTASRPARARGLKLKIPLDILKNIGVAPRAGAWIETV